MAKTKKSEWPRLDERLVKEGLTADLASAQGLVMSGAVRVAGCVISQAGTKINPLAQIEVSTKEYVGRGAYKLEAALERFGCEVAGRVCADVGAATGGFTEVMLRRDAKRVFAIDVGYGDLAWKLRQDPRVTPIERTNARYLDSLPEPIELAAIDVSFISLSLILPAVAGWFGSSPISIVALVKPQFELPPEKIPEGGVVIDPAVRQSALDGCISSAKSLRLVAEAQMESPITGSAGNLEYLVWFRAPART